MTNKKIGIVIVNYNGEKFQNECIESVLNSTFQNFYIIVVDNGSTDKSMELLNGFSDNRIIKIYNNDNLGVAEGNNVGIKKSIELNCSHTLLLNNDTVLQPNTLESLMMHSLNYLVLTPKIYFYGTNKIWYAGGYISKFKANGKHFNYKQEDKNITYNWTYDYAPTCCMLIENTVFNKIGMMDKNYFLYYDDTDFCMRLKLSNIPIALDVNTFIEHKVSLSTGGQISNIFVYYSNRNKFYFYKKHKKYFYLFSSVLLLINMLRQFLLARNKKQRKYILKAYRDFKENKMGRCDDL